MAQKPLDARFDDPLAHIEPISDDDAEVWISVTLAAHDFPPVSGKEVPRHMRDDARHSFAHRLVRHMRESRMGLFRTVSDRSLMMNTGMAKK